METDYPGWNATFMAQDPISAISSDKAGVPVKHDCNVPGDGDADRLPIEDGITYLSRLSGTAMNGPGPENCGRVSCSYNSAIIWCNNNNFYKELQWKQIADAARYESGRICADKPFVEGEGDTFLGLKVKGHADYDDGWYVVIRGDWC
ncbi:hypothetical protein QBC41DRAFT_353561 [Cercophora samala]|uniref:Uncharacterized protein n=1 Tax=Cercophora samala TaxID=330535 RepID=A0AA39ZJN1_9PEZI|nr:hypothetical protein QBC41DRAFT_353561 [Cercophora samala]